MQYYILQLVSSNDKTEYWTYVLDSNGDRFSSDNLEVIEAKLKELMNSVPISKLDVITRVRFDSDLIFD